MKKALMFLSSLLLILASCSNDDLNMENSSVGEGAKSDEIRWYGTKLIKDVQTRSVADGGKLWNSNVGIHIKFLNAPAVPGIIERVKEVALEWEEYAGIKFHFVEQDKNANVRIAFNWNGNDWLTWSYTGTDAKYERSQSQPTAVFGSLEYLGDREFRGDVLRLFGQILGLEYEQRHQEWSRKGYWRSEAQLQSYWEAHFEGYDMDWDEIREYVFDPLTEGNATQLMETRDIDEYSIMAWPHYSRLQTTKVLTNYELSEGDKEFIAQLYPKGNEEPGPEPEPDLPTIQEAWVDPGYLQWTDATKTALKMTTLGIQQESLPDVCDGQQLTSAYYMFSGSKMKTAPKFNTSNITNFKLMFYLCGSLTGIPEYDTSKGTDFFGMFHECTSLETIPLLNTSAGVDFYRMFYKCSSLTSIPLLNTANGTNFSHMFIDCSSLTSVPHLNTSKGTGFVQTFYGCSSLTSVPLFDTSNGTSFHAMFYFCSSLTNVPNFNTSKGVTFTSMFGRCTSLTNVPLLDTSNGTSFICMFEYCSALTSVPNFNTSKGTHFTRMFYNCSGLRTKPQLNLSNATAIDEMYAGTPFG